MRVSLSPSTQHRVFQVMNNVKAPYNVNKLTAQAALHTFSTDQLAVVQRNILSLKAERAFLIAEMQKLPKLITFIYQADANFVLFRCTDKAEQLYKVRLSSLFSTVSMD